MSTEATSSAINQLVAGQRTIALPFSLLLQDAAPLDVVLGLRLLPGKRLSARATWNGRTVMAKLFVRAKHGDRYAAAERQGQYIVAAAGVHTPALLWQGLSACGSLAVVLYEFLDDAPSLSEIYRDAARRDEALAAMLVLTAALHAHHAVQADPHLDNFLWHDGRLWLIDAGSVTRHAPTLPLVTRERNLALLLAQLPLMDHVHAAAWCASYNAACARVGLAGVDVQRQQKAIADAWRARGENVLAKSRRDCSATQVEKTWRRFTACRRAEFDATLQGVLADIDKAIATATMLKNGNSATVVRFESGGRRWVIKRYNMKSLWHRLRRCLRPSRAMQSWRNAHLLQFADIATPAPIAVVEQRFGPLRGKAWFVSEYVPGIEMLDAYQQREPVDDELQQTLAIFRKMQRALISHGDLKAQNLMIGEDAIVRLIDLDAMRWHRSEAAWHKAFAIDLRRFLRNWQGATKQRMSLLLQNLGSGVIQTEHDQ